jgi:hypothetical protein
MNEFQTLILTINCPSDDARHVDTQHVRFTSEPYTCASRLSAQPNDAHLTRADVDCNLVPHLWAFIGAFKQRKVCMPLGSC